MTSDPFAARRRLQLSTATGTTQSDQLSIAEVDPLFCYEP